jgi:hypothetical protein
MRRKEQRCRCPIQAKTFLPINRLHAQTTQPGHAGKSCAEVAASSPPRLAGNLTVVQQLLHSRLLRAACACLGAAACMGPIGGRSWPCGRWE